MAVEIRPQTGDDAAGVADLLARAFTEEPAIVGLERALSRRSDSWGIVAAAEDVVVGHVRLTRGWVDAPDRVVEVLVLGPLSVAPEHQRQGIGGRLLTEALAEAERLEAPGVFLEGDPGYYGRQGWRPAAEIGVTPPSDRIPAPGCQVVTLSRYDDTITGRLVYADTFWAHDCVGLRGDDLRAFLEDDGRAGRASPED
jgi:putative acetyltransferase